MRADSLRVQIEKYFEKILRLSLPWTTNKRERLGHLQDLRNILAHRNGRLMDMSTQSEEKVRSLVARIGGVKIETSTVVVSVEYVSDASTLVFKTVSGLVQMLADRYGGPLVHNET